MKLELEEGLDDVDEEAMKDVAAAKEAAAKAAAEVVGAESASSAPSSAFTPLLEGPLTPRSAGLPYPAALPPPSPATNAALERMATGSEVWCGDDVLPAKMVTKLSHAEKIWIASLQSGAA